VLEPRVICAGNRGPFTLGGTQSYLVGQERVAVIDPGPAEEAHVHALSQALSEATQVTLLLTHRHSDHAGAASALGESLQATILGTGPGAVRPLDEGEVISTDAGDLVVVPTPGHSAGHVAFHWLEAKALFAGDLVLGEGSTTWVGEYPEAVGDYLGALDRISELGLQVIYPAHGPPLWDPAHTISEYRQHRLDRIREVAVARDAHPEATVAELAELVYGSKIPKKLQDAVYRSAEAILAHLDSTSP
jgi:glyoxylase-like metal-dependent hydrolase (beta-lactamase superfamily II)